MYQRRLGHRKAALVADVRSSDRPRLGVKPILRAPGRSVKQVEVGQRKVHGHMRETCTGKQGHGAELGRPWNRLRQTRCSGAGQVDTRSEASRIGDPFGQVRGHYNRAT